VQLEQINRSTFSPFENITLPWLVISLSILSVAAVLVVCTPWYISSAVILSMLLWGLSLLKPLWGLHLIVLLVPVTSFSVGFIIPGSWNYEILYRYADKIPLLPPVVLATVLGLSIARLTRLKKVHLADPLFFASLLLLAYATLSLTWSANLPHSVFELCFLLLNILTYLALVALPVNEREYQALMWTWMISMAIQCLIAILLFYYKSVDNTYQLLPDLLFQFKIFGGFILDTGAPNSASGLQDFHETSLFSNMAAALAFGMLLNQKKRGAQFYLLIFLFILFLFITLRTESRAGIGSMLVMLVMLALLMPALKHVRIRATVLFLLLSGSIYAASHIYLYTMTEDTIMPRMVFVMKEIVTGGKLIDTAHRKKKQGRVYMYTTSFRTLAAKGALRGLGVGNLKYLVQLPHAHSFYFSLILDFGLAGCLFLAIMAKIVFQQLYRVVQLPHSRARTMALANTAGLVGAMVHSLADFEYNYTSVWLILGFVMSSYAIALSAGRTTRLNP